MKTKYENLLMNKLDKAFDSILPEDMYHNLDRKDVLAILAFAGMRVFRSEMENASKPLRETSEIQTAMPA